MNDIEKNVIPFKSGYVVIVGEPNVGKSTLMNNFLAMKLSIVTPKPQTTRHRVLGIMNEQDCQVIFLDTPGLMKPRYKLHEYMLKTINKALTEADIIIFMIDAGSPGSSNNSHMLEVISKVNVPVLLVINKIDLIDRNKILPIINNYKNRFSFKEIIPISALNMDGLEILKNAIKNYLPISPPFYSREYLTEQPERFFVAEIIREKIFQIYKDEIPYSTTVTINEFKERQNSKDFISATIYLERISQKGIIIGKNGIALKNLGQRARQDIEEFLGRGVYLELHVSVKEKWRSKDSFLKQLGYN